MLCEVCRQAGPAEPREPEPAAARRNGVLAAADRLAEPFGQLLVGQGGGERDAAERVAHVVSSG